MQSQSLARKYFFFALFLAALVLAVLILWPFVKVIVLAIALSVMFFPVYYFIKHRLVRNVRWLAALLTVLIFILILCLPLFLLGSVIAGQLHGLYDWLLQSGSVNDIVARIHSYVAPIFPSGSIDIKDGITTIISHLGSGIGAIFSATLATLLSFVLCLLCMFYFLKDGKEWKRAVIRLSPLSDESDEKVMNTLKNAINGIFKGHLLIGLAQGLLMGIGLAIFGVPNPALWGAVAAFASLVPTIGTSLISIPAILYLFAMGHDGAAVGMLLWAVLLVGIIDNALNPLIVGKRIDIHPLLVLFSVLGGIILMGPVGILIGPLVISFLYALASAYKTEIVAS